MLLILRVCWRPRHLEVSWRERHESNTFYKQNNNYALATLFGTFLPIMLNYDVKFPYCTFYGGQKHDDDFFFFLLNLGLGPWQHYLTWHFKRVEKIPTNVAKKRCRSRQRRRCSSLRILRYMGIFCGSNFFLIYLSKFFPERTKLISSSLWPTFWLRSNVQQLPKHILKAIFDGLRIVFHAFVF